MWDFGDVMLEGAREPCLPLELETAPSHGLSASSSTPPQPTAPAALLPGEPRERKEAQPGEFGMGVGHAVKVTVRDGGGGCKQRQV